MNERKQGALLVWYSIFCFVSWCVIVGCSLYWLFDWLAAIFSKG